MIANLKLYLLLGFIFSYGITQAKAPNRYQKIAEKFKVHPFDLPYGFPISYNPPLSYAANIAENRVGQIRGIIFLTDSIDYLEAYDHSTYICQPTVENAEMILKLTNHWKLVGAFYLVVDSSLIQNEVTAFIEKLGEEWIYTDIRFVGGNGRFVPTLYDNVVERLNEFPMVSCYFRSRFDLMINNQENVLLENRPAEVNDLDSLYYDYITINLNSERDSRAPLYRHVDHQQCKVEISRLENKLVESTDSISILFEIEVWKRKLEMTERFGSYPESLRNDFVRFDLAHGCSVKGYYQTLNQLNKAVIKARQRYCEQYGGINYKEAIVRKDTLLLELLAQIFHGRFLIEFGKPQWPEPPFF